MKRKQDPALHIQQERTQGCCAAEGADSPAVSPAGSDPVSDQRHTFLQISGKSILQFQYFLTAALI